MSCQHCVRSVEVSLSQLPGVRQAHVRVGEADVALDESVTSKADLFDAIRRAGAFQISGFTMSE